MKAADSKESYQTFSLCHLLLNQLCGGYNSTSGLRQTVNVYSTAYERSPRSQWSNPLAAVTMTYLFICSRPVVT